MLRIHFRAGLGCHRAHLPSPHRPAHTTAAGSGSVASAPNQSAVGHARPLGRAVVDGPPAVPTAPPPPSRPKTCRAASASSCRRIPPAKSSPDAASPCPSAPAPADSTLYGDQSGYFFGVSLSSPYENVRGMRLSLVVETSDGAVDRGF